LLRQVSNALVLLAIDNSIVAQAGVRAFQSDEEGVLLLDVVAR
jgi:hypothetical protein